MDRCGLAEIEKIQEHQYLSDIVNACCPDHHGSMDFRVTYNDPSADGLKIEGAPDGKMALASLLLIPE